MKLGQKLAFQLGEEAASFFCYFVVFLFCRRNTQLENFQIIPLCFGKKLASTVQKFVFFLDSFLREKNFDWSDSIKSRRNVPRPRACKFQHRFPEVSKKQPLSPILFSLSQSALRLKEVFEKYSHPVELISAFPLIIEGFTQVNFCKRIPGGLKEPRAGLISQAIIVFVDILITKMKFLELMQFGF